MAGMSRHRFGLKTSEQRADLGRVVAAVAAEGADHGQLAGIGPAPDSPPGWQAPPDAIRPGSPK